LWFDSGAYALNDALLKFKAAIGGVPMKFLDVLPFIEELKECTSSQQVGAAFVCARTDWAMRHFAEKRGARLDLAFGQIVADIPLGRCIDE